MTMALDFKAVRELYIGRGGSDTIDSLRNRVELLTEVVLTLMVEIEALRSAHLQGEGGGVTPSDKPSADPKYAKAYRETVLLSHNGAGVTTGIDKVVLRFFEASTGTGHRNEYRECDMLRRLGYSDEEVQHYLADVDHVSQLT